MPKLSAVTPEELTRLADYAADLSADLAGIQSRLERDFMTPLPHCAQITQAFNAAALALLSANRALIVRMALAEQEAELRAQLKEQV